MLVLAGTSATQIRTQNSGASFAT